MASIVARIIGDAKSFNKTVNRAQGKLGGFAKAVGGLFAAAGVAGLGNLVKNLVDFGSKLTDVSDKLGVSTDFIQEWNFAAKENGIASNASEMALQRFVRRLGEAQQGTGELLPSLKQYGIALFDSSGRARSAEMVLKDYADTVASVQDPQERLRLAFKAFDSEGAALVSVLAKGSAGLREYQQRAQELGVVLSEDTAKKFDKLSDTFGIIVLRGKVAGAEILSYWQGIGEKWNKIVLSPFQKTEEAIARIEFSKPDTGNFIGPQTQLEDAFFNRGEEQLKKELDLIQKMSDTKDEDEARAIRMHAIKQREIWQAEFLADFAEEEGKRIEERNKKEEARTEELKKQNQALADQQSVVAGLRQQEKQYRDVGQFEFGFQDILSGQFSRRAQSDAQRVLELQQRAQQALFFSGEDSEAFRRARGFSEGARNEFRERYGVDPVSNPFTDALKPAISELEEIKEEIQNL